MPAHHDSAVQRALADIKARCVAQNASDALVASDARIQWLEQVETALARPQLSYGSAGFGQVMGYITSPENFRRQRVQHLIGARRAGLTGFRASARHQLSRAAEKRRAEKRFEGEGE